MRIIFPVYIKEHKTDKLGLKFRTLRSDVKVLPGYMSIFETEDMNIRAYISLSVLQHRL